MDTPGFDEDPVTSLARDLLVEPESLAFLWELPVDLQASIRACFDPSGTKDGNVLGRLKAYARGVAKRNGLQPPASLGGAADQRVETAPGIAVGPGAGDHGHGSGAGDGAAARQLRIPGGAGDASSVSDQVWAFVDQLGLGETAAGFLVKLPEEVQRCVVQGFDPSGTKDGNVWGRLLGYIRSIWSRRLALNEQMTSYVRGLPEDVQLQLMTDFDGSGSKDGNVSARLTQFANHLVARGGPGPGSATGGQRHQPRPSPQPSAGGGGTWTAATHREQLVTEYAPLSGISSAGHAAMVELARGLGLEATNASFLQALPEDVQVKVVTEFDPSGTKDGNIWGRLFAFVRRVWARHAGVDYTAIDHLKSLPEDAQKQTMLEWSVQNGALQGSVQASQVGPGTGARTNEATADMVAVDRFVQTWGLEGRAATFLQALPEHISSPVLSGFDGSGTKDGNVWGRLLGYVRQVWARSLGLDQASMALLKGLPEEALMICLTDFDPSGTKDGNVAGRLQGFVRKALAQAGHSTRAPGGHGGGTGGGNYSAGAFAGVVVPGGGAVRATRRPSRSTLDTDPRVMEFLERCGLDEVAMECLETLPEDLLSTVFSEFDPSGTKDGNVLGRLQGYVRSMTTRRAKRAAEDQAAGGLSQRPRHAMATY